MLPRHLCVSTSLLMLRVIMLISSLLPIVWLSTPLTTNGCLMKSRWNLLPTTPTFLHCAILLQSKTWPMAMLTSKVWSPMLPTSSMVGTTKYPVTSMVTSTAQWYVHRAIPPILSWLNGSRILTTPSWAILSITPKICWAKLPVSIQSLSTTWRIIPSLKDRFIIWKVVRHTIWHQVSTWPKVSRLKLILPTLLQARVVQRFWLVLVQVTRLACQEMQLLSCSVVTQQVVLRMVCH